MKPLTFQPFCLCSTVPAPQNTQRQPFSNSLRTPLLRSLPWSPPEIATPSSTTTPDLHPATQGPLGPTGWARAHCGSQSEPARDSDTLGCQLEVKGKWLAGRVWERPALGGVSGIWMPICLHSGGRAPITRVGTPQRPEAWKVSAGLCSPTPLWSRRGN